MDDYAIFIPPELRKSTKFTAAQKMVLAAIVVLSKKEGYAWISNNRLSEDLGLSKRTVIRAIQKLEDTGSVEIQRFTEDSVERRTIKPAKGVVTKFHWGGAKMSRGVVTKLHPNITSNNIKNEYDTKPNEEGAVRYFKKQGSTAQLAREFYHHYESVGWKVSGQEIANWHALAKKWIQKQKPEPKLKILT